MLAAQRSIQGANALPRLIHLVRSARLPSCGVTVILGAGCSLTSSSDPLTTESIVRGWVEDVTGGDQTRTWPISRVWTEFVRHWDNLGHTERFTYLRRRLSSAEPGVGYLALAKLVRDGYIRRIVTTNFDPLLDRALAGTPALFQVGTKPPVNTGGGTPVVEVFKVHGDISSAEQGEAPLRFSPRELDQLPEDLAQIIKTATAYPTIVIGYSGADLGFMRALCRQNEQTAFWVVPDHLGVLNSYTGREVIDWLAARRATENIIDGPLGYFDSFMECLVGHLIEGREFLVRDYASLPERWLDTALARQLGGNSHLRRVAAIFFEVMTWSFHGRTWNREALPFAASAGESASAAALLFRHLPLNPVFSGIPRNEVDALLLILGVEVRSALAGTGMTSKDALALLAEGFRSKHPNYAPHQSFWNALEFLTADTPDVLPSDELTLKLNCQHRLMLIVNRTPLQDMRAILDMVDVMKVVHLPPPIGGNANGALALLLHSFRSHVSEMKVKDRLIRCRIQGLSRAAFRRVYEHLLSALPGAALSADGATATSRFVRIDLDVGVNELDEPSLHASGLFEVIEHRADFCREALLGKATPLKLPVKETVVRDHDRQLVAFLTGSKPAAILAGSSGSGKSVSVARMVAREARRHDVLPVLVDIGLLAGADVIGAAFPDLAVDNQAVSIEARLAAAVMARGYGLLLIVDGLNEASADSRVLGRCWRNLLELASRLGRLAGCPIKLLITCREGTLAALHAEQPVPAPIFFAGNQIDEGDKPWMSVSGLRMAEIKDILRRNLGVAAANAIAVFSADRTLAALYSRPFWLAVAMREILAGKGEAMLANPRRLVGEICDDLLVNALPTFEDQAAFLELIDAGFHETLERPENRSRNFGFAARRVFGWERKDQYDRILKSLVDAGIALPPPGNVLSDLRFSHDQVEEHFLGKFIWHRFEASEGDNILRHCRPGHYFANGLRALLSTLDDDSKIKVRLHRVIETLRIHQGNRGDLAEIVAEAFGGRTDPAADIQPMLETSSPESIWRRQGLISFFLAGMNRLLESGRPTIPDRLASALAHLLKSGETKARDIAEIALVQSQCWYRHDRFDQALAQANLARASVTGGEEFDYGLVDRVGQQQGVLLSKMGEKAAALIHLQEIFDRCISLGRVREAFEIGLELGAVLRDESDFEAALVIYERIAPWRDEVPPFLECRRILQVGTAKKNILQRVIEPARDGLEDLDGETLQEARRIFLEARTNIEWAELWATDNDATQLQLTCMSERAECLLVMAYVDSDQLKPSEIALAQFAEALDRHDMVTRRIEYYREMARLNEIRSDTVGEELRHAHRDEVRMYLSRARVLAAKHKLTYQVNDCDYQMARFCVRALRSTASSQYFHEGAQAVDRAIAYFRRNMADDQHYLQSAIGLKERLTDIATDLGIVPGSAVEAEIRRH